MVALGVVLGIAFIVSLAYSRRGSSDGYKDKSVDFVFDEEGTSMEYIPEEYDDILEDDSDEWETDETVTIMPVRPSATPTVTPIPGIDEPDENDTSEEVGYGLDYFSGVLVEYLHGGKTESVSDELWGIRDEVLSPLGEYDASLLLVDLDMSSLEDRVLVIILNKSTYQLHWEADGSIIVGLSVSEV